MEKVGSAEEGLLQKKQRSRWVGEAVTSETPQLVVSKPTDWGSYSTEQVSAQISVSFSILSPVS